MQNTEFTWAAAAPQLGATLPEALPNVSASRPDRGLGLTQPTLLDSAQVLLKRPSGRYLAC